MSVEAEDCGIKVEKPFRISVLLNRFFEDERARCYLTVVGRRRVRWLSRRLRRLFALPRPFCLLSRGHLLPEDEPLAILQPDDPVEVIPLSADRNWNLNEKSNTSSCKNDSPKHKRKRKCSQELEQNEEVSDNNELFVRTLPERRSVSVDDDNHLQEQAAPEPQTTEPHDALQEVKEKALALLEQYESDAKPIGSEVLSLVQPRRTRRRVRRRRPRVVNETTSTPVADATQQHIVHIVGNNINHQSSDCATPSTHTDDLDGVVLTNGSHGSESTEPEPAPRLFFCKNSVTTPVLRNDDGFPRMPRVVRSMSVEG